MRWIPWGDWVVPFVIFMFSYGLAWWRVDPLGLVGELLPWCKWSPMLQLFLHPTVFNIYNPQKKRTLPVGLSWTWAASVWPFLRMRSPSEPYHQLLDRANAIR